MLFRLLGSAACLVPLSLLATASQGPTPAPEPLLLPLEGPIETTPLLGDMVLRSRTVAVRTELLAEASVRPGGLYQMELFPDLRVLVRHVSLEQAWGDGLVWNGVVTAADGSTRGTATLSVMGSTLAGSVRVDHKLYRIDAAGPGLHRVSALDEERFPVCGVDGAKHAVGGPAASVSGPSTQALSTNLPTIDVLVVYTTLAMNNQGGLAAIQALINLAVSETNTAYANSDVNQRLRLVHMAELVGYVENGNFNTELSRLQNPGDGFMDNVHALRDQHGADEVSMIVHSNQYCGIAYLMTTASQSFQSQAFNVTSRTCATGYYSFGHELGHNMGSHHDLANAGPALYPYSYGWRTANGAWRTILAYAPGTRIQYFSNPSKTYNGQVLGSPNAAENFRSLNNTAPVTSQWRCANGVNYGVAKTTSLGGAPVMTYSGQPVFDGSGSFQVRIQNAVPNQAAIVFYGDGQNSAPFYGGTLLVQPPTLRLPPAILDGAGNASFSFPITSYVPGDEIYFQGWFRDPLHPDMTAVGLTNGLRIDVCRYNN